MVNLVVRHASPHLQQGSNLQMRAKSPAITTRHASPTTRDRSVPSPIRVPSPYHRQGARPVSPMTTTESMFGTINTVNRSQSSGSYSGRRRSSPMADGHNTGGDLVCDYDNDVTPLYELLESSQWDKARLRCRTHPEEVQTWIVRRDATTKIRWKLLPLHAAVIFQAPTPVIQGMLKEYPIAAGKRDDQGMLPLHLAFRHKQEESLLEILLEQYPQGVSVKDRRDRLPIDHGKETLFSSKLLTMYADVYSKCLPPDVVDNVKDPYEEQMDSLKTMYEERLDALVREHEQNMRDMKHEVEQDQHVVRTQHDQEMDEMRDMLSREVGSSQRASQLELEAQDLRTSLEHANQETQVLRSVLHDQKAYQDELKNHMREVLSDQEILHTFCVQQQEQLEQAEALREQLLRTLIQKEDGKTARASREISQLSDNIRLRTEKILNQTTGTPEEPHGEKNVVADDRLGELEVHHHREDFQDRETTGGWETTQTHDIADDISAITEISNF